LSAPDPTRARRAFLVLLALVAAGNTACWEQWSETWFPQMKWQKAIQAFERVQHVGPDGMPQIEPFMPADGAVSVAAEPPGVPRMKMEDMMSADLVAAYDAAVDAFQNPTLPAFDPADPNKPRTPSYKSLVRGKQLWDIYCTTCHGTAGMGDGPVSQTNATRSGPFSGVFPVATAMSRSDGYIYNLIRVGGDRMPSYERVAPEDRWHLVNYTRHLQNAIMTGGQP
jgi:mono/diheme cytochrome c family protein